MRHDVLSLILGSFLFLTGCEPTTSLHPLITPEAAIFDPSLQGDWIAVSKDNSEGSAVLTFSKRDPSDAWSKDYSVRWREGEVQVEWLGHLGFINEELYLDLSPKVELNGDGIHLLQGVYIDPSVEQKHEVVVLSDELLLEIQTGTEEAERSKTAQQLSIKVSPIHWFFNVKLTEKGLQLGYLDDDNLSDQIKDKKVDINCVLEPRFFLTAKTDQLQRLVVQVSKDPGAFTWIEFEKGKTK